MLNLVLVAKADGEIKPIDVLYLSRCKNKIDASHRTLADAIMRSYWESVVPVGEIVGNEQCLKDMINMAMIDGDISCSVKQEITKYIDVAKIPKTRVEHLMREAMNRFNNEVKDIEVENAVRIGKITK